MEYLAAAIVVVSVSSLVAGIACLALSGTLLVLTNLNRGLRRASVAGNFPLMRPVPVGVPRPMKCK